MFGSGSGAFSSGTENTSGFGQTNSSLFNQTTQPNTGLFGSTAAAFAFGQTRAFGGTFTAASGFGATYAGGSTIKFNPVTGTDTMILNGINRTINIIYQSITIMKEYDNTKIFEVLRFEDYSANRKFGQQGDVEGGIFGSSKTVFSSTPTTSTDLFEVNDNKPLFSETSTTLASGGGICGSSLFRTPTSTTAFTGGLFGQKNASMGENTGGGLFGFSKSNTVFGQSKPVVTGFSFGAPFMQPTSNIFGTPQPSTADTSMFGASTTGFNAGGICGSSLFGTPTSTSASTGGLFGQKNASMGENTGGGLFGSSKSNTAFGQSKSVGTGFSFGTPFMQPTSNIFGTPQPSTADTRMCYDSGKTVHPFSIPQTIQIKPKQSCGLPKIVLGLSWSYSENKCITNWYDPAKNLLQNAPEMFIQRDGAGLCIVKDKLVVAVGGSSWNANSTRSVEMLDVSSQSIHWIPKVKLLVGRKNVGVGVLDGCIYAVGGCEVEGSTISNTNHNISQFRENNYLNSVEVFNFGSQQWRMVTSMSNKRSNFGVGVLNNLLYAVGGFNGSSCLKFVECYNPILDTWNPIAEMSVGRLGAGIGVLDGIMYAIGGTNASVTLKSVEAYRPNTGVWTSIADMNLCRQNPGVVVFDGLLYVMGGKNGSIYLNSLEIYNPNTNFWSMKTLSTSHLPIYGAVVVDRPPNLTFKK
ncbi:nuclear pore complex protein Nup98-Nup96-like isoform X2 [Acyrthosiphon pisum]|uniref:Nuclear pore complex protein Nup98-Nup96 n=1 Tax=Acyrthosiphon pisum TaxID=7029 RepID=A0A8R2H5A1_ACYPI|nr:nuclear pore complex protein Nup98-Nup96-like isoform X2 [Acyrthosiphon pisum]|eukprot:XP_016658269.1 PREDICTED: nuclear pore complex protein Nup98-Nup96-like isoform X2 [Acyrthosiphon pisum]